MEFQLLGEVEARVDGEFVELGHARQRCVLVALLADANTSVPADELLERVWADRPPARGRDTLYSYVSRLRRALSAADGVNIGKQAGGYVLRLDPDTVDLHLFQRYLAQARTAEDPRAQVLLERALGLWRGEAFAGLDTPWVNSLRARVEQARHTAEIDLVDLKLRAGRHAEILGELATQVSRHPFNERLASQYLLALYRSGRQRDALAHYQQVRRLLAEELGADPGPLLRETHRRILTADSALAPPAPAPPVVVPRQLPAPPATFVARAGALAELDKIAQAAAGTVAISAIGGPGGIGKTWLALHWAHRNLDRFPDGQLYVDLRGFDPAGEPLPPEAALRGFLDALGAEPGSIPATPHAQAGLYRSLVATRSLLIVLDNAHDTGQILPLLPGSPTCTVLVTSRRELGDLAATHGAHPLILDGLDEVESRELLTGHLGHDRTAAEPQVVTELIELCEGIPLALSIAAARAAARPAFPLAVVAEELRDTASRLDALDTGGLTGSMRAVFAASYRNLSPRAAEVFTLLAHAYGPDVSRAAVASLSGLPAPDVPLVLRELRTAHLVQEDVPGRYRMHDLLRLYAGEQAARSGDEDTRQAAARRLADFYLHTAHAAERLLHPHRMRIELGEPGTGCQPLHPRDETAALAWLAAEHANVLAAQRLAIHHGWHDAVWRIAWTLDTFHRRQGYSHHQLRAWRAGLAATECLDDPAAQILAHRNLGIAFIRADQHDQAVDNLERAMALAGRVGDVEAQAHTLLVLAYAWECRGDNRRALDQATRALPLFQTLGNPVWEAQAHNQVGKYSTDTGEYEQGRIHADLALTLFRRHSDRDGEADALSSLGQLAQGEGEHLRALDHFRQALRIHRDLGHSYAEADTLDRLARTHAALGQNRTARQLWKQALALYDDQNRTREVEQVQARLTETPPDAKDDSPECQRGRP
ncbi:AfsR/SARP family transcriptional regulator [Amycolatopsis anabasis]|uniref:AfsR/SARP family transcriptional regulator n=1 Tax=Amycolatopsis anabasis TaxID=1840409 RepID=UPI001C552041|nr:AfsR/SARP family transcriptional regulator [Amycolatopsis anabasis]